MTNREAIDVIKSQEGCYCNYGSYKNCHSDCNIREALDLAVKALEASPIESITTKGGMTLSLRKTDIEISDLVRCIANALKDITVEELADKYNTITFTDDNSCKSVSYCRVDNKEAENE